MMNCLPGGSHVLLSFPVNGFSVEEQLGLHMLGTGYPWAVLSTGRHVVCHVRATVSVGP